MSEYKVAERFISINGEGIRAGQLAVFIRFCGCNLDCSYCDTSWANQKDVAYTIYTAEELYQYIKESGVFLITLTGGEPLLQPSIYSLIDYLSRDPSLQIEIETNGSVSIKEVQKLTKPPSLTMDYKLPCSDMESHMLLENFAHLKEKDTVKFVVASLEDLDVANKMIRTYRLTNRCHVFFSPVFQKIPPIQIVNYMKENQLNGVSLQLQMHKFIWPPQERGV